MTVYKCDRCGKNECNKIDLYKCETQRSITLPIGVIAKETFCCEICEKCSLEIYKLVRGEQ